MATFPVSDLCKNYLKYEFRNIVLLYEALTHGFDEETEWIIPYGNIRYKKKGLRRLKLLGLSVLNLLCTEQAVYELKYLESDCKTLKGRLNIILQDYQSDQNFLNIGNFLSLKNFIQTAKGFNGDLKTLFRPVIFAVFGAVFVDSGGCDSDGKGCGLHHTRKLFLNLWNIPHDRAPEKDNFLKQAIKWNPFKRKKCDSINVRNFLSQMFLRMPSALIKLQDKLDYDFSDHSILEQSLTHDSVNYKIHDDLENVPNYEMLEFLGDAVYQLVICECMYWYYVSDDTGTYFNTETINEYTNANYQNLICRQLELIEYVMKEEWVRINDTHDFLESLVGAIYVDSGRSLKTVRKVILHLCMDLMASGKASIPFSVKTYCGSSYRQEYSDDDVKCPLEDAEQQPSFKIDNVIRFVSFGHCMNSMAFHAKFLADAIRDEENGRRRIENISVEECNRLEYQRTSLYRTVARIIQNGEYDPETGNVTYSEHTYSARNNDPRFKYTQECNGINTENTVQDDGVATEVNLISREEFTIAFDLLIRWTFMWMAVLIVEARRCLICLWGIPKMLFNAFVGFIYITSMIIVIYSIYEYFIGYNMLENT